MGLIMKSSIRTYRIISITLMICCGVILMHSNHQKNKAAEMVDEHFDLVEEYYHVFDEVLKLEQEMSQLYDKIDSLEWYILESENIDTTNE